LTTILVSIVDALSSISNGIINTNNKLDALSEVVTSVATDVTSINDAVLALGVHTATIDTNVDRLQQCLTLSTVYDFPVSYIDSLIYDSSHPGTLPQHAVDYTYDILNKLQNNTTGSEFNVRVASVIPTIDISGTVTVEPGLVPLDVVIIP